MTENQLKSLLAFQKTLASYADELKNTIQSEEFEKLDGLNKDLMITEFNQVQATLGISSVRIGLNISSLQDKRNQEESENAEEQTTEGMAVTE